MFRQLFVFVVLSFWIFPAFSNVCLHPIEEAALFSGKSKPKSRSDKIKKLEKEIEDLSDDIDDIKDNIDEWKIQLENSFNDNYTPPFEKDTAVDRIKDYIDGEEDEWEPGSDAMPWDDDPDSYFKSNGRINQTSFCKAEWMAHKEDCEEALEELEEYISDLKEFVELKKAKQSETRELIRAKLRSKLPDEDEEETEADGLCWECLDEIRELNKPTSAQTTGNVLSLVLGGAMSYYGYKAGKRGAQSVNDLRMRQGFDALGTAGPSWAGATLGMPFIANGIYGLANGNSVLGNYSCAPGMAGGGGMYAPFAGYGNAGFGGGFPGAYGGVGGGFGGGFPGAYGNAGFGAGFGGGFPGVYGNAGFGMGMPMGGAYGGFPGFGGGFGGGMTIGGGFPGFGGGMGMGMPMGGYGGFPGGFGPGFGGSMTIGGFPGLGGGGFGAGFPGFGGGMTMGGGFPGFGGGMGMGMGGYGGFPGAGGYGGFPGAGGYGGFPGAGGYGGFPGAGMNPQAMAQMQAQQQQYANYMKFQQTQMQAQIQAQQAWLQHQQSVQQDYMQRQQVIGGLTQEMYKIQQQIQMVASGGVGSSSILGASTGGINTGLNLGTGNNAPTHNPAPGAGSTTPTDGNLPIVPGR